MLLNSASSRFPYGLANSTGLVRKNLMLHPWPQVFGYVDEEVDGDRGPQTDVEPGTIVTSMTGIPEREHKENKSRIRPS